MEYRKYGDTWVVRLELGEEICSSLLELAEKENIELAEISGLGAADNFTTGIFDLKEKKYHANHYEGFHEITSLTGTLTRKDGKPYLHVHMSAAGADGCVVGGHLSEARVGATAEIVVRGIEGSVGRKLDEGLGINLMEF